MLKIRADTWNPNKFKELGRGGEAVVYKIRADAVAKIFHLASAPEFADSPQLKEAAKVRLEEMQRKLPDFPENLPEGLIAPTGVLAKKDGKIFGYVMPFVPGTSLDKLCRTTSKLTPKNIKKILSDLYQLVKDLHSKGIIIGDFNENNIIVRKNIRPYLIDADSMQFGPYQCRTFMPRFVAPELVAYVDKPSAIFDKKKKLTPYDKEYIEEKPQAEMIMVAPHTELTDWYSFLVIAMRLFTFTDPYGGVVEKMDLRERIEKRITIFDPRVKYPLVARPLKSVPRPILEVFYRVFHKGQRFVPNEELFRIKGRKGVEADEEEKGSAEAILE